MALRPMGDEIEPGMRAAVDRDPTRVDAFAEPELGQRLAETVGADGGEIGGVRAEPRRRDHRVRGVAAEALDERRPVLRLVELDQRFADRQKVRHAYLAATATATPAITPPAKRWTSFIALVELRNARARLAASA